ncbi:MAG: DUF3306 domain-containing protein [Casimicrobiaceae bacterium]
MSDEAKPGGGFSLRRWSTRKLGASAPAADPAPAPLPVAPALHATPAPPRSDAPPSPVDAPTDASAPSPVDVAPVKPELPPIDSLTPLSDFAPFMQADVAPQLRSAAMRKLFADPHFNVMDGLDIYIGDYSKADPISPEVVKTLMQARYIFAPPPTRMNPAGFFEDVPEEELAPEPPPALAAAQSIPPEAAFPLLAVAESDPVDFGPEQIRLPLDAPPEDAA